MLLFEKMLIVWFKFSAKLPLGFSKITLSRLMEVKVIHFSTFLSFLVSRLYIHTVDGDERHGTKNMDVN